MTRILGIREVRELLTLDETIELQRAAFLALARGRTAAAPNGWLRLPGDERRGWLKLLAGFDEATGGLAVKVLARFPRNPPGQNLGSLLLLFDEHRGEPLAVMDAVYVTAVRTAAGAALATEALARPEASAFGLLGTGTLAWYSVLAHRPATLTVHSRSPERREAFARRARDEAGVAATTAASVAEAVDGADVVITATNSPEPVLLREHLTPGQHVNAIGMKTEIAPDAIAACRVIGDGREETLEDGKFSVALAAGAVTPQDLGPDLGAVLDGAPGRTADEEITLFDSSGVAIQDVVCARRVWERAEEAGAGVVVDLGGEGVLDA